MQAATLFASLFLFSLFVVGSVAAVFSPSPAACPTYPPPYCDVSNVGCRDRTDFANPRIATCYQPDENLPTFVQRNFLRTNALTNLKTARYALPGEFVNGICCDCGCNCQILGTISVPSSLPPT
eukprot:TRINITY_DN1608_c0_g1_i5.p2 TRINITY_DN1608_c0_g1~~TRINITY_DN1608_c0_g1_i5.p2  ORF type:complete len:124 (+),score=8.24 TRINITY_DN1608_c0_g1_i5:134-505(+)